MNMQNAALNHTSPSSTLEKSEVQQMLKLASELLKRKEYQAAQSLAQIVNRLAPRSIEGLHIEGVCLLRTGQPDLALPILLKVERETKNNGFVCWQIANAYLALKDSTRALQYYSNALEYGVQDRLMIRELYKLALDLFPHKGEWNNFDKVQRLGRQAIYATDLWIIGESTLASPFLSNDSLLRSTRKHANKVLSEVTIEKKFEYKAPNEKIRLGFVGCDFREQATSYLMVEFIEKIDRNKFELIAYEFGEAPADSLFRKRVVAAYDRFVRIEELSDAEAADLINCDGIHILLSIKNPASTRLGIFARKPAPIQIHYLYFPGTSGMPFFDYIVADDFVIPHGLESGYQEQVLRLECCYQPNDSRRFVPQDTSRESWGLPADAVVLGNFNQLYKLTPQVFDLWCALLRMDEKRVLWLMADDEQAQLRLIHEARMRGVEPKRLFFGKKLPTDLHLNRMRHADLIVDTYPYGGHTLGGEALWSGTPFITLCGETFASRVGGSLLKAVGMEELIAYSEREYLQKADALLLSSQRRQHFRQQLDDGRISFSLFNSENYAACFEKAMAQCASEIAKKA